MGLTWLISLHCQTGWTARPMLQNSLRWHNSWTRRQILQTSTQRLMLLISKGCQLAWTAKLLCRKSKILGSASFSARGRCTLHPLLPELVEEHDLNSQTASISGEVLLALERIFFS